MPRKTFATLAAFWILAYPTLGAWGSVHASSAAKPKTKTTTTVTGSLEPCKKWGPLQVRIKVEKTVTTVGKKRKVAIKILDVTFPVVSDATFKTKYINQQALPLLREDVLALQTTKVENISGATDTWVSFTKSLNHAMLLAKK